MRTILKCISLFCLLIIATDGYSIGHAGQGTGDPVKNNALLMIDQGRKTFRFDTFGDEAFWGIRSNCIRQSQAANWEESGAV